MVGPLGRIRCPMRAFWGEADPFLPADRERLDAFLRERRIGWELVPAAGHWAQYEGAVRFNAALGDWLESLPGVS